MNRKIILSIFIIFVILVGVSGVLYFKFYRDQNAETKKTYSTIEEYAASIDYSCNTNSDCAIKDVRNCCGYYPKCTNKNAKTDPDFVKKACDVKSIASVCGFPSIDGCECVQNKCKGISSKNP